MEITCYPTYGYKKDGAWKIPMRVWVHTNRSLFGHPITHLLMDHSVNFENRIADLVAHNEEVKGLVSLSTLTQPPGAIPWTGICRLKVTD